MSKNNASKQKLFGRSKKYSQNFQKIKQSTTENGSEIFEVEKAIELLSGLEQPNFKNGTSLEIHAKLNIDPTKGDQLVRGSVVLPHGSGKQVRICAFVDDSNIEKAKKAGAHIAGGEELIEEIKKTGQINFDIAIAEPDMMKKLPAIARILGTAGVMPNPKNGTVDSDFEKLIKEFNGGRVNYRNDKSANLHLICGKLNGKFNKDQLLENVQAVIDSIEKAKPEVVKKYIKTIHLSSTMSPSVRIR